MNTHTLATESTPIPTPVMGKTYVMRGAPVICKFIEIYRHNGTPRVLFSEDGFNYFVFEAK